MRLTRDSALWTITLIASVALFLSGHFELLTRAFPALEPIWQARIELLAACSGFVSGWLKMSPLRLHPESPFVGTSDATKTINPLKGPEA